MLIVLNTDQFCELLQCTYLTLYFYSVWGVCGVWQLNWKKTALSICTSLRMDWHKHVNKVFHWFIHQCGSRRPKLLHRSYTCCLLLDELVNCESSTTSRTDKTHCEFARSFHDTITKSIVRLSRRPTWKLLSLSCSSPVLSRSSGAFFRIIPWPSIK